MSRVRPLRHEDLPQVVELYRQHLAWPHVADPDELKRSFEQIFLGEPLSDPDIPSLVFERSQGSIVGFIGSLVHRLRLHNQPLRLATSSSLVVAPHARPLGAGGLLMRKYLAGPQDLTMTDTAGVATEQMWKRLGGSMWDLGSVTWLHILAPARAVTGLKLWHQGRHQWLPRVRPVCRPLDAAYTRITKPPSNGEVERFTEQPLTAQQLIDNLHLGHQLDLWPDYEPDTLDQLFELISGSRSNGRLDKNLVRDTRGQPLGWYIASLLPSDIYRVLGFAATPGNEEPMLRHVLDRARQLNAAAVAGRLQPGLLGAFPRRTMMFSRVRFLVHSRDQAITDAARSSKALLTGIEGDVWIPR